MNVLTKTRVLGVAKGFGILLAVSVIVPLITVVLLRLFGVDDLRGANNRINQLFLPLFVFRCGLYGLYYVFFDKITLLVARRRQFTDQHTAVLLTKRPQIVLTIVAFEVFITGSLLLRG